MKKQPGRFSVTYASGRQGDLSFKTYEGKDYKDLLLDLTWAKELGAVKEFNLKLGKQP